MDREYSNIYSAWKFHQNLSQRFRVVKCTQQQKYSKAKTLQKSRKYPKIQFQILQNIEYR